MIRTFFAVLAAVVLLVSSADAKTLTKGYSHNYGSGGTTVKTAIEDFDDEFETVWDAIELLWNLQAGADDPTGNNTTNDLFLDTTTSPPVLKYYTGSAWNSLFSSGFTSTLSLDNTFLQYSENVIPKRTNGTTLTVSASATAPATISVAAGEMYQNTSDVTINFTDVADGTYAICADQDGTSTNFAITRDADTTCDAGVKIGEAKYDDSDNDFIYVRSVEDPKHPDEQLPYGFFHAYNTDDNQAFADTVWEKADLTNEAVDGDGLFSSGTYSPTRVGLYWLSAGCEFSLTTSEEVGIRIKEDSTVLIQATESKNDITVTMVVDNDGNDAYTVECYYNGGTGTENAQSGVGTVSNLQWGTHFWGYYLGRKY